MRKLRTTEENGERIYIRKFKKGDILLLHYPGEKEISILKILKIDSKYIESTCTRFRIDSVISGYSLKNMRRTFQCVMGSEGEELIYLINRNEEALCHIIGYKGIMDTFINGKKKK